MSKDPDGALFIISIPLYIVRATVCRMFKHFIAPHNIKMLIIKCISEIVHAPTTFVIPRCDCTSVCYFRRPRYKCYIEISMCYESITSIALRIQPVHLITIDLLGHAKGCEKILILYVNVHVLMHGPQVSKSFLIANRFS